VESNITQESMLEESPKPRNFFSRLEGVYFSPKAAFQEIGCSPRVLIPIVVFVIIGLLSGYYLTTKVDFQALAVAQMEQRAQQGQVDQEQMEQQMAMASKFMGLTVIVGAGISSPIICLIIAGFIKLISTIIGAENRYKSLLAVCLYTMIAVSIVSTILMIVILYFKQPGEVSVTSISSVVASNLGAVLESILGENTLPKFVVALARGIDLFNIWIIALLAIGTSAVSKKLKTSTVAVWLGGAYAIILIISATISALSGSGIR
jgi:Yip1 domain